MNLCFVEKKPVNCKDFDQDLFLYSADSGSGSLSASKLNVS